MSFQKSSQLLEPNVQRVAHGKGLLASLGALEAIAKSGPPVAVLRLPPGADVNEYLNAAAHLMLGRLTGDRLKTLTPRRDRKGAVLFDDIMEEVEEGRAVLVLVEAGQVVPPKLLATADVVADVSPLSAEDLRAAAREVMGLYLTDRHVDKLLTLPQDLMLAAMKPGRSFAQVIKAVAGAALLREEGGPRLDELGGYGQAKVWGLELASDIHAWRKGQIAWKDVDAGMLLSGPPGTGKTLYAAALARSCDLFFVATSVAQWQAAGHLGEMLAAMRSSFKTAVEKAPALLFIDEFDSVRDRARFGQDDATYWTQVVNGLLEALDGSTRREGVVVVGATNFPENIDLAFLRPGRLGRHIRIRMPDLEGRAAIARTHLGQGLSEVDLQKIASATEGMSGAEIAGLAKDARRKARVGRLELDADLVLSCIEPALPLVDGERRVTCIHEAGHVVVGLTVGYGSLVGVAVLSEVRLTGPIAGGAVFERPSSVLRSQSSYLDEICLRLAGIAAERVVVGEITDGGGGGRHSDLALASEVATLMVSRYGMGATLLHFYTTDVVDRERLRARSPAIAMEVAAILDGQLERAEEIVRSRLAAVEAIAAQLDKLGGLTGKEVEALLDDGAAEPGSVGN